MSQMKVGDIYVHRSFGIVKTREGERVIVLINKFMGEAMKIQDCVIKGMKLEMYYSFDENISVVIGIHYIDKKEEMKTMLKKIAKKQFDDYNKVIIKIICTCYEMKHDTAGNFFCYCIISIFLIKSSFLFFFFSDPMHKLSQDLPSSL